MGHLDSARRDADITSRLPKRPGPSSLMQKTHADAHIRNARKRIGREKFVCGVVVIRILCESHTYVEKRMKSERMKGSQKVKERPFHVVVGYS